MQTRTTVNAPGYAVPEAPMVSRIPVRNCKPEDDKVPLACYGPGGNWAWPGISVFTVRGMPLSCRMLP